MCSALAGKRQVGSPLQSDFQTVQTELHSSWLDLQQSGRLKREIAWQTYLLVLLTSKSTVSTWLATFLVGSFVAFRNVVQQAFDNVCRVVLRFGNSVGGLVHPATPSPKAVRAETDSLHITCFHSYSS